MRDKAKHLLMALAFFLVVVLLAGVIPSFMKPRKAAQRNACLNNLRMMDSVLHQGALANRLKVGDPVPRDVLAPYFRGGSWPTCPSDGEYIIGRLGEAPTCSFHGDLLERNADDYIGWKCCQWMRTSNLLAGNMIIEPAATATNKGNPRGLTSQEN